LTSSWSIYLVKVGNPRICRLQRKLSLCSASCRIARESGLLFEEDSEFPEDLKDCPRIFQLAAAFGVFPRKLASFEASIPD
jgi:hypothetical protein